MESSKIKQSQLVFDASSYRDPDGCVFFLDGDIYRTLSESSYAIINEINESGFLKELIDENLLVQTEIISPDEKRYAELTRRVSGWKYFLSLRRILLSLILKIPLPLEIFTIPKIEKEELALRSPLLILLK